MTDLQLNLNTIINNKNILITGGTSWTFQYMIELLLEKFTPNKIIIYSRDEYKQSIMKKKYPLSKYPCMRYFIGCVRDKERLEQAFEDVDIVFHVAAMKQIDTIEYNPNEAIKTNVDGTNNVIYAAKKCGVKYVLGISTDKSSNPACLYGATKYCAEKLLVAANNMCGGKTKFSAVRYGNVLFSKGSVAEIFLEQQKQKGELTVTNTDMTRFTITAQEAVHFTLQCLSLMIGGEVFIPQIKSYKLSQLVSIFSKNCSVKEIGLRPGEKMHETMIADYESHLTIYNNYNKMYILLPSVCFSNYEIYYDIYGNNLCSENWCYNSKNNDYISDDELEKLIYQKS